MKTSESQLYSPDRGSRPSYDEGIANFVYGAALRALYDPGRTTVALPAGSHPSIHTAVDQAYRLFEDNIDVNYRALVQQKLAQLTAMEMTA